MWKVKVVSSLHSKFSSQEKSWYFNGLYNYWLFLNTWHHLTEKNCCRTYHLNPWASKLSLRSNQMDNQAYFEEEPCTVTFQVHFKPSSAVSLALVYRVNRKLSKHKTISNYNGSLEATHFFPHRNWVNAHTQVDRNTTITTNKYFLEVTLHINKYN